MPILRSIIRNTIFESGLSACDRGTQNRRHRELARSRQNVSRERRKRYPMLALSFMRMAGIVHTAAFSSISSHLASSTSLVRVAVTIRNSKRALPSAGLDRVRSFSMKPGTFAKGNAA